MYFPLQLLPCIMCGTFKDFLHELNFWMSSGGTRSVIHFDADHNVHCLVAGRKDFMMIDPKFSEYLNVTQVSNGDVFTSNTFSSPEAAILVVSATDRDLWQGPGNAQAQ